MTIREPLELQRLRYWQGQTLRSRDLRDQVATEAQLRWWHNRALHNAFGVASGFEVQLNDESRTACPDATNEFAFEPDGQSVIVCPGLAYDCFGRELILQQTHCVKIPEDIPEAGYTLLVRYRENNEIPRKATGVCLLGTASRPVEEPSFVWKQSNQVEIPDGVPLARLNSDGSLDTEAFLPRARALTRPFIVTGTTIPGNTSWGFWYTLILHTIEFPSPIPGVPPFVITIPIPMQVGIEVKIDTSAAGFAEIPCYFAWLQGSAWDQTFAAFQHIHQPTIDGFVFRIWSQTAAPGQLLQVAQERGISVCWLGIQPGRQDDN